MFKKLKNMLVRGAIVASGAITTGTTLSSCNFASYSREQAQQSIKERNPGADTTYVSELDEYGVKEEYAERFTDSTKIKLIKEKYLFRLTQYEQSLDSLKQMQAEINGAFLQAAKNGDLDGIMYALENGADINAQSDKTGNTALMNVIEYCNPTAKAYEIAMYLLGEPSVRTLIENKRGISALDMLKARLNRGEAEWEALMRKFNEPTCDASRKRGNSEIDRFAEQIKQTYNQLMETYGKEMRAALGYVYKANHVCKSPEEHVLFVFDENSKWCIPNPCTEIITNEDGTRDTLKSYIYTTHPVNAAKLKLRVPQTDKYLAPEEIATQIVHKSRRKNYGIGHRYHKTVTDTYTVTTTRDGQQHVVQTGRGR